MSAPALALALSPASLPTVGWTHVALMCLVSALAVALLLLGIYLWHLRRARPAPAKPPERPMRPATALVVSSSRRASGSTPMTERRGAAGAGGGLAVASSQGGAVACPSCRREFAAGTRFCSHDARRLVPSGELVERSRVPGSVCPRCRRAFDPGVRACPHDGEDLIQAAVWEATRGRRADLAPTGVLAKICPHCAMRYDLATSFCGRDGAELMTIN